MTRPLVFVWLLLFAANTIAAEPPVVDLWPGKPPKEVGIEGEEHTKIYESPILKGPTKLVTNVTQPTLTIYQPPKEKNTGTTMLICPGGGYHNLFWELEGEEVAAWLNSQGMTGIILKYRCPRRPGDVKGEPPLGPLLDAQRAVSLVRSRAKEWDIHPQRIGLVGFSAGGHLAVATATRFEKREYDALDEIDKVSCRPDFAIGCYSGYLKHREKDEVNPAMLPIPAGTPPIFLAHTSDDNISDPANSALMYLTLLRAKAPVELHIFVTGDHDFGVRQNGKLAQSWTGLCVKWLVDRKLLEARLAKEN